MADQDARALLLTIQANTELLRSNLSAAEKAIESFTTTTQAHLDESDKRFEAFGSSIEHLEGPLERLKQLGEVAVGALLGESLLEAGKKGLEFAGNVQFVSEQVGTSTDFLQKYRFAAGQFGVGTQEADEGLNKFARSVGEASNGNKQLIDLFDRLGVNVRDAGGNVRSVESVFVDTSNAISKIKDPAQQSADVLGLFGRGAAGLKPLLEEGASGFSELARQAEQLGVVLSPELIEHSEEVNHKLAALKSIVDAQLSSAIAQNAASIEVLASALVKAAGGVSQFLNQHPERALALLGALAGSRFGPIGSVVGAGVGYAAGTAINLSQQDDTGDLAKREAAFRDAAKRLYADQHTDVGSSAATGIISVYHAGDPTRADIPAAQAEFVKQRSLYQQAYVQHKSAPRENDLGSNAAGVTNDNGQTLKAAQDKLGQLQELQAHASGDALKGINQEIVEQKRKIKYIKEGADAELASSLAAKEGSAQRSGESAAKEAARKAEALRQKNLSDDITYAGDVRKLREEILAGMRKTATNDTASDALQVEGINADAVTANSQNKLKFDKGDFGSDPKVAQARLDNLNALVEQNRAQKVANVGIERQSQTIDQALALTQQDLQTRTSLLQIQDAMATTAAQRRKLELQLLDIQQQQVRLALQKVLDDPKASDDAKVLAQKQKDALPAVEAAQRQQVAYSTRGPGEQYAAGLNGQGVSEDLQQAGVSGLGSLESGLTGVLDGTKSVSAAFHEMATSIITDLVKIAVEQAIIKPLASSLFGGGAAGSVGGGIFSNILGAIGIGTHGGGVTDTQFASDASLLHFAGGGMPTNDNGHIRGAGTGRSDSILARLPDGNAIRIANGEFIMNAEVTARNLPLLRAMNEGRLPGFADGGLIGARVVIPARVPDLGAIGSARLATTGAPVNHFHLEGAVVTQDLVDQMNAIGARAEERGAARGFQMSREHTARRNRYDYSQS